MLEKNAMSIIRPANKTIQLGVANAALTKCNTINNPTLLRTAANKVKAAINAGLSPQKVCRDAYRVCCRALNHTFSLPAYGGAFDPEGTPPAIQDPNIVSQPRSATIPNGGGNNFSVTATGNSALSYQWQVSTNGGTSFSNLSNTFVYSGVTSSTLGLGNVDPSYNGNVYRCAVTDTNGTVYSSGALLTVI